MPFAQEDLSRRHLLTGTEGEEIAVRYLLQEGYQIIRRNYRTSLGEIDIIAQEGETLVFVEVKTRRGDAFGSPQSAVDLKKQSKITRVALIYIEQKKLTNTPCRFDVVAVKKYSTRVQIELIRNAFEMTI